MHNGVAFSADFLLIIKFPLCLYINLVYYIRILAVFHQFVLNGLKMTKILCIDPGRESAWLVGYYQDEMIQPEIFTLHCKQKHQGSVYQSFYGHGLEIADGVEHIVYEEPFVRSHKAARLQYGMGGLIYLIASHTPSCKAVWPIHPSHIKLEATGKGNASKDEMIQSAIKELKGSTLQKQIDSSHAADVFWIYRHFVDSDFLEYFDDEE